MVLASWRCSLRGRSKHEPLQTSNVKFRKIVSGGILEEFRGQDSHSIPFFLLPWCSVRDKSLLYWAPFSLLAEILLYSDPVSTEYPTFFKKGQVQNKNA